MFTRDQALDDGWTPRQVKRRLDRGTWVRVLGRGLTVAGSPLHHLRRCWAVRLTWPALVISHASAARLLGWPLGESGDGARPERTDGPPTVHVTPRRTARSVERRTHAPKGVTLHRVPLDPEEIVRLDGSFLITGPTRTAVDCLSTLSPDQALDLYAWLVTRDVLDHARLRSATDSMTGRPGVGQLRELVRLTASGAVSGGEYRLHHLLERAGITGWVANARIIVKGSVLAVADVLFAAALLVIEFDGRRAHTDRSAFVRDRRRQNALQRAGYLVLRYTWADLEERPDAVVREIRDVLAGRAGAAGRSSRVPPHR